MGEALLGEFRTILNPVQVSLQLLFLHLFTRNRPLTLAVVVTRFAMSPRVYCLHRT